MCFSVSDGVDMAHRVNVVLDDDVWQGLQAIPGGECSRFVYQVLSLDPAVVRSGILLVTADMPVMSARLTPAPALWPCLIGRFRPA